MADLKNVGSRTLPAYWADLFDPAWYRSITLAGSHHDCCRELLLTLFQDHGPAAIKALATNILRWQQPIRMDRSIGGGSSKALYINNDIERLLSDTEHTLQRIYSSDGGVKKRKIRTAPLLSAEPSVAVAASGLGHQL